MKAIIRFTGLQFRVYTLDQEGTAGDEVWSFLTDGRSDTVSSAKGYINLIQHIAHQGLGGLNELIRDCWVEDGETFCELKRNPWRVSFFQFGQRLLLVTVFRKHGMKEKKEYRRAVQLYREFRANQRWKG